MSDFNSKTADEFKKIINSVYEDAEKKASDKLVVFEHLAHHIRFNDDLQDFQDEFTRMAQSLYLADLNDCVNDIELLFSNPYEFSYGLTHKDFNYFLFGSLNED